MRQERTSGPGDRTGSVNPTRSKAKRGTWAARPLRPEQSPGRPRRWMATGAPRGVTESRLQAGSPSPSQALGWRGWTAPSRWVGGHGGFPARAPYRKDRGQPTQSRRSASTATVDQATPTVHAPSGPLRHRRWQLEHHLSDHGAGTPTAPWSSCPQERQRGASADMAARLGGRPRANVDGHVRRTTVRARTRVTGGGGAADDWRRWVRDARPPIRPGCPLVRTIPGSS